MNFWIKYATIRDKKSLKILSLVSCDKQKTALVFFEWKYHTCGFLILSPMLRKVREKLHLSIAKIRRRILSTIEGGYKIRIDTCIECTGYLFIPINFFHQWNYAGSFFITRFLICAKSETCKIAFTNPVASNRIVLLQLLPMNYGQGLEHSPNRKASPLKSFVFSLAEINSKVCSWNRYWFSKKDSLMRNFRASTCTLIIIVIGASASHSPQSSWLIKPGCGYNKSCCG
jgi:hypothetical protein